MFKIAVFVSGRGSNLIALSESFQKGELKAEISAVVSNKSTCKALEFAKSQGIPFFVVTENTNDGIFVTYENLTNILTEKKIDLIVLAGFLKKIPLSLIKGFKNKIINIHPALLPSFGGKGMYGINVHKAVFNSSVRVTGPTVHFVDEIYDNGKIIDQDFINISQVKSPEEIAAKVLELEHKLLPRVVKNFVENKIKIVDNRVFID